MCTKCSLRLIEAYEFKVQFEKSDIKLREYLAHLSKKSIKEETSLHDIIDFNSLYNTEINIKSENVDNSNLEFHEIPKQTLEKFKNIDNGTLFNNLNINDKCTQTEDVYPLNYSNVYCCEYCDKKFSSVEGLKVTYE